MTCLIQAVDFANGTPCPHAGQYVERFDFDTRDGRGYGSFTKDPTHALHFADKAAALSFWRTVSKSHPTRPDGRPNRPLTALTVSIVNAP
jgi:hypothetical protein